MAALVALAAGARLMLDGAEWTVQECHPQSGRVALRGADGQRRWVTIRALVNDPGFRPAPVPGDLPGPGRPLAGLEDLDAGRREQLHLRVAHLLEAETGFRSGTPLRAGDGEPRPEYDPDATTLAGPGGPSNPGVATGWPCAWGHAAASAAAQPRPAARRSAARLPSAAVLPA